MLGLNYKKISNFDITSNGNTSLLILEIVDNRPYCPYCLSRDVKIKGYYNRYLNDSIVKHQNTSFEVRQRRYVCKNCNKTFTQKLDFVKKGDQITYAVKQSILLDLGERRTIASIAREHKVSPATVLKIFDDFKFNEMSLHMPLTLCIDEFHFVNRKSMGKFPAVISDYITGNIIDLIIS